MTTKNFVEAIQRKMAAKPYLARAVLREQRLAQKQQERYGKRRKHS